MTEVKKQDKELLSAGGKLFNISTYAKQKVANKRAKKGFGELKPRETNPYKMFFQYIFLILFLCLRHCFVSSIT